MWLGGRGETAEFFAEKKKKIGFARRGTNRKEEGNATNASKEKKKLLGYGPLKRQGRGKKKKGRRVTVFSWKRKTIPPYGIPRKTRSGKKGKKSPGKEKKKTLSRLRSLTPRREEDDNARLAKKKREKRKKGRESYGPQKGTNGKEKKNKKAMLRGGKKKGQATQTGGRGDHEDVHIQKGKGGGCGLPKRDGQEKGKKRKNIVYRFSWKGKKRGRRKVAETMGATEKKNRGV